MVQHLVYVYVYWDNSNILGAQEAAEMRENSATARFRVWLHFRKLLMLPTANRLVRRAIACGSLPPELNRLLDRLEDEGVFVDKYHWHGFGERQVPDTTLLL